MDDRPRCASISCSADRSLRGRLGNWKNLELGGWRGKIGDELGRQRNHLPQIDPPAMPDLVIVVAGSPGNGILQSGQAAGIDWEAAGEIALANVVEVRLQCLA